jgi:tRNA-dihydrouridine synthase A
MGNMGNKSNTTDSSPWRISVAPMMDWTDRHCRYFHRLLTRHALLYTEMVTTGALLNGDIHRHLQFNQAEHRVALQLGGSETSELARCARLGQEWGYDEINLNCGCPSDRVQKGAFGASLMARPALVADGVKAMLDTVDIPVTVKHRIGIDRHEDYGFVRDFVGTLYDAGCRVFIVHARNAWLDGLSPKENRDIPPLRYERVHRLKQDFVDCTVVLNGGLTDHSAMLGALDHVDGVMVGREAYHNPWPLSEWDRMFHGCAESIASRDDVEAYMAIYMEQELRMNGIPWRSIARHMLGLRNGQPGARHWRRIWSDHRLKESPATEVMRMAQAALKNHQEPSDPENQVVA